MSFFQKKRSLNVYSFTKKHYKVCFLTSIFQGFQSRYLSRFRNILEKCISQENLLVVAANRCKDFQIFMAPKIICLVLDTIESEKPSGSMIVLKWY